MCYNKIKKDHGMKKTIAILICIFALVLGGCRTAKLEDVNITEVRFVYGESDISEDLDEADARAMSIMFSNRTLVQDWPSCGFSEDISVITDEGKVFCIARDGCGTIYSVDEDLYFTLTEEQNNIFLGLLHKYGVTFPCQ